MCSHMYLKIQLTLDISTKTIGLVNILYSLKDILKSRVNCPLQITQKLSSKHSLRLVFQFKKILDSRRRTGIMCLTFQRRLLKAYIAHRCFFLFLDVIFQDFKILWNFCSTKLKKYKNTNPCFTQSILHKNLQTKNLDGAKLK